MKTPQLITLFNALSDDELKKFSQFLKSPYYNATPKMKALCKHLKVTHPNCTFEQKDKESVFSKLFPKEVYSSKKINNLTASLSSILQDFLLLQYNKSGTLARDFNLFRVYNDRKLDYLSKKQLHKLRKTLESKEDYSLTYYYQQLRIYHELYSHPHTVRAKGGEAQSYLDAVFKNLDLFYTHTRLRHLCEMNFRGEVLANIHKHGMDEIHKLEQYISSKNTPLLDIYKRLYLIQISPDEERYIELREKVFKYIRQGNLTDRDTLLTALNNYQAQRSKEGSTNYLTELFNIYEFLFKTNIYFTDIKYIENGHFLNISIVASELKKITWLTTFIAEQQTKLNPDSKENIVNLSTAYLRFAKGEYQDALALASQTRNKIPNLALPCWSLEIRAHYKTENSNYYLEDILKNFAAYLRRHDKIISPPTIAANRNLITLIRHLSKSKYDSSYTKERLKNKLESMKNIVCKYWLEQEIKNL